MAPLCGTEVIRLGWASSLWNSSGKAEMGTDLMIEAELDEVIMLYIPSGLGTPWMGMTANKGWMDI